MFIPVTAPQTFDDETATFEILTMWLACKKICVLGEHETKLTLSTNPKTEGPHHKDMRLLRWQKRLPKPLKDLKEGSCHIEGTELVISGISGDQPISFIGLEHMGIRFNRHKSSEAGGGKFTITVPLTLDFTAAETDTIVVEGLLLIGRNPHDPSYVVRVSAKAPN
jgi:DsbC/DsbD-like thiol-disulfide interchange protein